MLNEQQSHLKGWNTWPGLSEDLKQEVSLVCSKGFLPSWLSLPYALQPCQVASGVILHSHLDSLQLSEDSNFKNPLRWHPPRLLWWQRRAERLWEAARAPRGVSSFLSIFPLNSLLRNHMKMPSNKTLTLLLTYWLWIPPPHQCQKKIPSLPELKCP